MAVIICDADTVQFPHNRKEQAADLMALAGDALISGDRIAWKILYFASRTLEEQPEQGTPEADAANHEIDKFLSKRVI